MNQSPTPSRCSDYAASRKFTPTQTRESTARVTPSESVVVSTKAGELPGVMAAVGPLMCALKALGNSDDFAAAFSRYDAAWRVDPLGAFGGAVLVSATAVRRALSDRPLFRRALELGNVYDEALPLGIVSVAVDVVLAYVEADGPSLVNVFGSDLVVWRVAAGVMMSLAIGAVLAHVEASAEGSSTLIEMERIVGIVEADLLGMASGARRR